jgi:vacuolar iron transporter family protein
MSLAANPEAAEYNEAESREVLSLSYQIRGLPAKEANRFVDQLANDKSQFVSALAQERLNMTEKGLRKPWNQLFSGALSTAVALLFRLFRFPFLVATQR